MSESIKESSNSSEMATAGNTKTPATAPQLFEEINAPTATDKLIQKSKQTPFVPIGIAGTLATVAYGVYAYKNRGPMSTSRYIMKFRVLAQGAVVCAMIVGVTLSSR